MTDHELNTLFARHVAKLGAVESHWGDDQDRPLFQWSETGEGPWHKIPDYVNSADAVLPWLEKHPGPWNMDYDRNAKRADERYQTYLHFPGNLAPEETMKCGNAASFAKSAVLALLKAHGVDIPS